MLRLGLSSQFNLMSNILSIIEAVKFSVALLENAKLTLIQNILSLYAFENCLPIAEILVFTNALMKVSGCVTNNDPEINKLIILF